MMDREKNRKIDISSATVSSDIWLYEFLSRVNEGIFPSIHIQQGMILKSSLSSSSVLVF